jgi:hypothetical protein
MLTVPLEELTTFIKRRLAMYEAVEVSLTPAMDQARTYLNVRALLHGTWWGMASVFDNDAKDEIVYESAKSLVEIMIECAHRETARL